MSDTGYSYKQGVGKTKVVRSPSPSRELRAWGYGYIKRDKDGLKGGTWESKTFADFDDPKTMRDQK